ncbi:MAG TPA: hypothetical protein VNQ77_05095 [Frankiaceae bacterium]|nr:hypothetical protein [Frankiaceae bacterium]
MAEPVNLPIDQADVRLRAGRLADFLLRCFAPYRPDGYTRAAALATFDDHVGDPVFRTDLDQLVVATPGGYDIGEAAAVVRGALLDRLDDADESPSGP